MRCEVPGCTERVHGSRYCLKHDDEGREARRADR